MHFLISTLKKGCQALFCAFSYFYLNLFSSTEFNTMLKRGVKKKGVRHSFMHFLSFILISLFLFFSTCGKKSPNPPVRQTHQFAKKRVSKKGCQALFCAFSYFYLKKRVSGTLLCIFLLVPPLLRWNAYRSPRIYIESYISPFGGVCLV